MKVGLDVIEIDRVRATLERYPSFRERCFTEAERNRWRRRLEETAHLFW